MSNSMVLNFDNTGRTYEEAYDLIGIVLDQAMGVIMSDVDQVASACKAAVSYTHIAGIHVIVSVVLCRNSGIRFNSPAVPGTTVMIYTHSKTPNNRGCSVVGNILMNQTFATTEEAQAVYTRRVEILSEEAYS